MKTRKTIAVILSLVLLTSLVWAAGTYIVTFTGETFTSTSTNTDTSSTVSLRYANFVTLATTVAGLDSGRIIINVDGKVAGAWSRLTGDTILPATAASGGMILRNGTYDLIPGVEQIRIRNTMSAGDSSSATSYTQHVILRY